MTSKIWGDSASVYFEAAFDAESRELNSGDAQTGAEPQQGPYDHIQKCSELF